MVKNRGIEVSIISQFDIKRLPEFHTSDSTNTNERSTVTCYVPIYPGSQIWFEYTIEPPHPPNAAYFFKLSINGRAVTAWDCTERHGYHGKTTYLLEKLNSLQNYPRTAVQRRGFQFSSPETVRLSEGNSTDDCIEIWVHRIEHRRRIYGGVPARDNSLDAFCSGQLQLMNGGALEPGRPQRRYKYQLLDPMDEPYAIFRFLYRTYDYLWQNNIIDTQPTSARSDSSSSLPWYDALPGKVAGSQCDMNQSNEVKAVRSDLVTRKLSTSPRTIRSIPHQQSSSAYLGELGQDTYLPLSDSDDSLSVVARDSIEDLPSIVPRSPESPHSKGLGLRGSAGASESPQRHGMSPRQRLKKRLTLESNDAALNTEKRRPLSPFTSGGFLRRMLSPEPPPAAPAATSLLNPFVEDDATRNKNTEHAESERGGSRDSNRTARSERVGKSLIRFLSRRNNRAETTKDDDFAD